MVFFFIKGNEILYSWASYYYLKKMNFYYFIMEGLRKLKCF